MRATVSGRLDPQRGIEPRRTPITIFGFLKRLTENKSVASEEFQFNRLRNTPKRLTLMLGGYCLANRLHGNHLRLMSTKFLKRTEN